MNWSVKHIEQLKAEGRIRDYSIVGQQNAETCNKKSKYRNTKTEVDGIVFDSTKEAKRYKELKLLLKTGRIGLLQRQVEYELNAGSTHSLKYIADFVYRLTSTGEMIVEDVKGFRTAVYRKKKQLMKKVWGIQIKEI